jgi:PIN domain nuclease of toxin-antitoxin system
MNYLLDTHTIIWSITEKNKLSPLVRQTLENVKNSIFVSSVNLWEVSLKFSLGKLEFHGFLPEELPELILQSGFQLIPLSAEEAAIFHKLPKTNHMDPFDRMLIWQAIQRNLIFITRDENMSQYREAGLKILW